MKNDSNLNSSTSSFNKKQNQRNSYQFINANLFPKASNIIKLDTFLEENVNFYTKILKELHSLKVQKQKRQEDLNRISKRESRSIRVEQWNELRQNNEMLRQQIVKTKEDNWRHELKERPLICEKQREIKDQEDEKKGAMERNKQIKKAVEEGEMIELYETMCRECEQIRKINNDLSEELKMLITDTNKQTGGEENPNMFMINLKL